MNRNTPRCLVHTDDVALDAVTVLEFLTWQLLSRHQNTVAAVGLRTDVDDHNALFIGIDITLDHAGNDLVRQVCVFVENLVALCIPQTGKDGLTNSECSGTLEVFRRVVPFGDEIALVVSLLGKDYDVTVLTVDFDARILCRCGGITVALTQCSGDQSQHFVDRNTLFLFQGSQGS